MLDAHWFAAEQLWPFALPQVFATALQRPVVQTASASGALQVAE